ncbi:MAG: hypothetical protein WD079_00810, partial [Phycisphaeraceae bacterium]
RFLAPRLVTVKPRRVAPSGDAIGELAVYLHNDSDAPWQDTLVLRQISLDGEMVAERREPIDVAARASARVLVPDAYHNRPGDTLLVADVGEHRGTWFFEADKHLPYPEPAFNAVLERDGDVHRLTLTAGTLLRDLCLFPDRLDASATIDDQFLTLLPGESKTFEIRSAQPLTVEALTSPPVCQCANRFGGTKQRAMVDAPDAPCEALPASSAD